MISSLVIVSSGMSKSSRPSPSPTWPPDRALRKFYDLEIVDYELRDGNKGPERKYYSLTPIGRELLGKFIERNVKILYNRSLVDMLFQKRSKMD